MLNQKVSFLLQFLKVWSIFLVDWRVYFYRQRTLPNTNKERSVQGQINEIIIQRLFSFLRSVGVQNVPCINIISL